MKEENYVNNNNNLKNEIKTTREWQEERGLTQKSEGKGQHLVGA